MTINAGLGAVAYFSTDTGHELKFKSMNIIYCKIGLPEYFGEFFIM